MAVYADLIFYNGNIYTVDKDRSQAEAVAVAAGKILFVGSNKDAKQFENNETEIVDLQGKMVLPGFFDSHTHASMGGVEALFTVDLNNCESQQEAADAVKKYMDNKPDAEIIIGVGWGNAIGTGIGPRKEVLDEIAPNVPVCLYSEDHHSAWVNSKALELAEITAETVNPKGGVIERDPSTGEPSGTLRESAMNLIEIPDYTVEQYKKGILAYQKMAAACGITSAHEPFMKNGNVIKAYSELEKEGKLTIRYRNSLYVDPEKGLEQVEELVAEREKHSRGSYFQTNSAKFFIDGVVEGATAYLEEPYEHIDSRGELVWDPEIYKEAAARLHKERFTIHIHSIGDASTRISLDGLEYAESQDEPFDSRHAITHLQLVNPEDIDRMKKLNVVSVPNPYWFMKEPSYYFDIEEPYLGKERAARQYPMQSLIDAGIIAASASDYPVTMNFHPLNGIQLGVTRTEIGKSDEHLINNPAERTTLANMIESFTINGAYSLKLEQLTGSIEQGKKADLIVLDRNLFEIPEGEISQTKVQLTLFEGKETYRDKDFIAVTS
ncbi:amidohydrolase [Siminovitchia acidinfaciens]|uniref:Amidohydrolase n=1 Tax=Siminovitchia acidinfaciens TaxID=2321395 RepID=A0A429XU86_9BACI|nr:amidohydrolase [Siminovitchia acidinfaciens]RST71529.1 amidohydrolase [Siminovitchia acidinfaciens]